MRATTQPTHRLASLEDTVAQVEGAGGVKVGVEGEVKEALCRERIKTKIQEQGGLFWELSRNWGEIGKERRGMRLHACRGARLTSNLARGDAPLLTT